MRITRDATENLIAEEEYLQLPTKYIIKKFGQVQKQVLLTFDDGPDPEYTPQILDILKKKRYLRPFFCSGH
ncbi:polysaccharide deacetylase family protein [Niabella sp. W65]|nr:polysaccharide deacetylase family protein [Niabella sp. W65]MCH7367446.1 polysaccharide deacetylase family protein [Niabella sp. W65]